MAPTPQPTQATSVNWPLISVIIPTYGREEPLRDTLEDVIKQDYPALKAKRRVECWKVAS